MGYLEAKEDGIRIVSSGYYTAYYPKCHICGEEVHSMRYKRNAKYTCKDCKLAIYLADREEKRNSSYEVKERKYNNAVNRLKKMGIKTSYGKYKEAIEKVHSKLHTEGWFDSTEEIMTAIELEKNNINYRHQVKFGNYKVDFVLDDEKIILEVDGVLFHTKNTLNRENIRDGLILLNLGAEWEVVRITDEMINHNIRKLVPAIMKLRDKRRALRKAYGYIPEWYSDRKN